MSKVTQEIAQYVSGQHADQLDSAVRHEAARAMLNFFACAIGASRHATVEAALSAVQPFAGPPQSPIFGRRERLDALNAALINGTSSHVFDFDDTILSCAFPIWHWNVRKWSSICRPADAACCKRRAVMRRR